MRCFFVKQATRFVFFDVCSHNVAAQSRILTRSMSLLPPTSQENLLRMVHIEYSLKGKRDLLKAGRVSKIGRDRKKRAPRLPRLAC